MHYSRLLASVALVAVSCGAPVADQSSSSSESSSYSASVTPSASATTSPIAVVLPRDTKPYNSSSSSAYYPSVTPSGTSGSSASPAATFTPIPAYHGVAESTDQTYDFAAEGEPFATTEQNSAPLIAIPPSKFIYEAPFAVDGEGDDTTFVTLPDEAAVEGEGEDTAFVTHPDETAVPFDGKYAFDNVEEPNSKPEDATDAGTAPVVSIEEPTTQAGDNADAGTAPVVAIEEPKFQAADAKQVGTGPALRKHCK